MLKKMVVCLAMLLALTILPILGAEKAAAKKGDKPAAAAKKSGSGSMTLIDAIRAAQEECKAKYPDAVPFKAEIKSSKSGKSKFDISLKVNEESFVKVSVSMEGNCKLNDKKGELFPMKKGGSKKGGEGKEGKKGKGKGGKKKGAEEEEESEE